MIRPAAVVSVGAAADRIASWLIAETETLLADLGIPGHVSLDDDLERDLGLGSIECVELLGRLERTHGLPLLDRLVGDARSLRNVLAAITGRAHSPIVSAGRSEPAVVLASSRRPARVPPGPPRMPAPDRGGMFVRGARAIRRCYMALTGVPVLVLGCLIVWAFCRRRGTATRAAHATVRLAAFAAGLRPRLEGQTLSDRPAILISNHASWLDALILIAVFDRPVTLTPKATLFTMPILGTVLRRLGYLPVDRGGVDLRVRSYQRIRDAAARGDVVHLFPEGTIKPEIGVQPFRLGAFRLAAELGLPLVPIAIGGSRVVLRDGEWWPSPGQIAVTVLEQIPAPVDASPTPLATARDSARARLARTVGEPLLTVKNAAQAADGPAPPYRSARGFRTAEAPQDR